MCTCVACAWRVTLVSASWTMRNRLSPVAGATAGPSGGRSRSQATPVRCWKSRACDAMAAASPMSSRIAGRSIDDTRRAVSSVWSTRASIAWARSSTTAAAAPASVRWPSQPADVQLQRGQRLADLVVDLARDHAALLLAYRVHPGGQRPQLLVRGAQLLLGLDLLRHVGEEDRDPFRRGIDAVVEPSAPRRVELTHLDRPLLVPARVRTRPGTSRGGDRETRSRCACRSDRTRCGPASGRPRC